jgi:superoxide dismutase, Cu-Zn family
MQMTRRVPLIIAATAFAAALPGLAMAAGKKPSLAKATVLDAKGATVGRAWISGDNGHAMLKLDVEGLPAGIHGVHLHTVGACTQPDFASAGGHLNPSGKMHGKDNPQGSHLGDLPNLTVEANGKGVLTAHVGGTDTELAAALFDADGTAIVVHAGADDYRTDPSGNSGSRIACGVLTRG